MNHLIKVQAKNLKRANLPLKTSGILPQSLGEPETRSGKQELLEQLINMYIG